MKLWILFFIAILMIGFVSAQCIDTDGGKNKYEPGTITDQKDSYSDVCDNENIQEYFCSIEGIAEYTTLQCVNGCDNGACLLANEKPITAAPETESNPNLKWYFYGAIIILIIGIYIYLFKWKKKKRY